VIDDCQQSLHSDDHHHDAAHQGPIVGDLRRRHHDGGCCRPHRKRIIAADCTLTAFMREENMDGFFGGGKGMTLGSKMTIVVEGCTVTLTNSISRMEIEKGARRDVHASNKKE
jgi:hypothetical protein